MIELDELTVEPRKDKGKGKAIEIESDNGSDNESPILEVITSVPLHKRKFYHQSTYIIL